MAYLASLWVMFWSGFLLFNLRCWEAALGLQLLWQVFQSEQHALWAPAFPRLFNFSFLFFRLDFLTLKNSVCVFNTLFRTKISYKYIFKRFICSLILTVRSTVSILLLLLCLPSRLWKAFACGQRGGRRQAGRDADVALERYPATPPSQGFKRGCLLSAGRTLLVTCTLCRRWTAISTCRSPRWPTWSTSRSSAPTWTWSCRCWDVSEWRPCLSGSGLMWLRPLGPQPLRAKPLMVGGVFPVCRAFLASPVSGDMPMALGADWRAP